MVENVIDPSDEATGEREPSPEDETAYAEAVSENDAEHESPNKFPIFPKVDFSGFFPKIELPEFATLFPKVGLPDLSPFLPKIEPLDLMPSLRPLMADAAKYLAPLFDRMFQSLPPNWPSDVDLEVLISAIQDDGLPLVWVPRAEVVTNLLATPDRPERVQVLISHTSEIVEDCRVTLSEVTHASLSGQRLLAEKALAAFKDGHHEAAQALAVVVTETAVTHFFQGKNTADIKKEVNLDPEYVYITQLRAKAALAPIGVFFTAWYPNSGAPAPEALSRHVSVHQADQKHYSRGNAVVAILLVTSVLRALQELQEL